MRKHDIIFNLFLLLTGLLLLLVPFLWFSGDQIYLWGDDGTQYFLSPAKYLQKCLSSWSFYIMGSGNFNPVMHIYLPFVGLIGMLQGLGISAGGCEKFFFGMTLSGSCVFTYLLIMELTQGGKGARKVGAWVGGIAYALSGMVILVDWTTMLLEIYLVSAFPLLTLIYVKYIRNGSWKWLMGFLAVSVLYSASLAQVPWVVGYGIGFLIFMVLYKGLILREDLGWGSLIWRNIKLGFWVIMINSYWIAPMLLSSFTLEDITRGEDIAKGGAGMMEEAKRMASGLAKDMNIRDYFLGLFPEKFLEKYGGPQGFYRWMYGWKWINGIMGIGMGLAFLLGKGKGRRVLLSIGIPFLILLYLSTVHIGKYGIPIFSWLIEHIPGWTMCRNFYGKFPISLGFFYALLLGYSVFVLMEKGEG